MAEKKPLIVIKRIEEGGHGHHGGAWKVAFADFMTAMMAFFLVMWLLANSSEETRQGFSDYFSTPSVIEYHFQAYGAELTLEKLFSDLVNHPLEAVSDWLKPLDRPPNMFALGTKKARMSFLTSKLGEWSQSLSVHAESTAFEIPMNQFFAKGSAEPLKTSAQVLTAIQKVIDGVPSYTLEIDVRLFWPTNPYLSREEALVLAQKRAAYLLDTLTPKGNSEKKVLISAGRLVHKGNESLEQEGVVGFSLSPVVKERSAKNAETTSLDGEAEKTEKTEYDSYVDGIVNKQEKKENQ